MDSTHCTATVLAGTSPITIDYWYTPYIPAGRDTPAQPETMMIDRVAVAGADIYDALYRITNQANVADVVFIELKKLIREQIYKEAQR